VLSESRQKYVRRGGHGICIGYAGGKRGAEEYLITKDCLGFYAQDRTTSGSLSSAAPTSSLERRGACSFLFYAAR